MNHFLLIVNILLALGTLISFGSNIESVRKSGTEITVPKRQPKKVSTAAKADENVKAPTVDENISAIINGDIFNPERTPNTGGPNSGRSEMTLAGTFKVGKVSGAIVIQRTRHRQFNPFMPQFAFGPGGRFGGGGPGGDMRGADGRLGSMRQRFTQFNPQQQNNVRGGQSGQLSTGNRQSVKVGETLSNGYTLIEVGRASAVLVRGSDRVELVLQDPSKVKSSGRSTAPSRPSAQQMMMATQRQMLNVMQNMQRSLSNQGGGGGNRGFGRGGRR